MLLKVYEYAGLILFVAVFQTVFVDRQDILVLSLKRAVGIRCDWLITLGNVIHLLRLYIKSRHLVNK